MNETCNVTTALSAFSSISLEEMSTYRHKVYRFTLCPDGRIATGK